ncbi:hypothetical protein PMI13_01230 [Chryseobacterium populi]|uniref:Uncharacterized protein n=1 Tax=Chryseobacterium populi TaxID=1144316 RepID=J3CLJ7_9FLAO|nr:hypothetical protein PMI13_01230 [Chryseobacterium populi]
MRTIVNGHKNIFDERYKMKIPMKDIIMNIKNNFSFPISFRQL